MKKKTSLLILILILLSFIFILIFFAYKLFFTKKTSPLEKKTFEPENYLLEEPQKTNANNELLDEDDLAEQENGFIEGSLSYPSEGFPTDLVICAQNIVTQDLSCTADFIKDSKYTYGLGYILKVEAGKYYIYARSPSFGNDPDYKAYFSKFVLCGLKYSCHSHEPILVIVKKQETYKNADPGDWYIN
ncbi:hypothetical protein COT75_04965 [Candidatus Beckwithbacteria bacterium CG10_big_fil_rev_8_21_14_0_10_34_10]|uniref:Carboxypeptidase regulatory-like domain-containing protein n=1 Tax=Candidatus Beckwithbacteria bacterium CG10_big_fil_rev_8_21_14_0_10_34_10 TaxID=1974495 RepID=A0A2H0W806_9BACT|nr:MAG: hypothetical protein COT75_04965 [Candidatus Beckwithbacteria bacterium CG10_big_fil_rev_8_21_14_0_10_34_10]